MTERLSEEKLSEIEALARQARPNVDAVWMTGELVAMAREASRSSLIACQLADPLRRFELSGIPGELPRKGVADVP